MITSTLFGYTVLFDQVAGMINRRGGENCQDDDLAGNLAILFSL